MKPETLHPMYAGYHKVDHARPSGVRHYGSPLYWAAVAMKEFKLSYYI